MNAKDFDKIVGARLNWCEKTLLPAMIDCSMQSITSAMLHSSTRTFLLWRRLVIRPVLLHLSFVPFVHLARCCVVRAPRCSIRHDMHGRVIVAVVKRGGGGCSRLTPLLSVSP